MVIAVNAILQVFPCSIFDIENGGNDGKTAFVVKYPFSVRRRGIPG